MKLFRLTIVFLFVCFLTNNDYCQCFQRKKKVTYNISYLQSSGISSHEKVRLIITDKKWSKDTNQIQAIWKYSTKRLSRLKFSTNFSIGWLTIDTTGIIDNEKKIWFHPPRNNQYSLTEVAPFPDFRKKLSVGNTYSSIIYFGAGLGEWTGKKSKNEYLIVKMKIFNGDSLWSVTSSSICCGSSNSCFFILSKKEGFIYIEYLFYNKDKLVMVNNNVKDIGLITDQLKINLRE